MKERDYLQEKLQALSIQSKPSDLLFRSNRDEDRKSFEAEQSVASIKRELKFSRFELKRSKISIGILEKSHLKDLFQSSIGPKNRNQPICDFNSAFFNGGKDNLASASRDLVILRSI